MSQSQSPRPSFSLALGIGTSSLRAMLFEAAYKQGIERQRELYGLLMSQ